MDSLQARAQQRQSSIHGRHSSGSAGDTESRKKKIRQQSEKRAAHWGFLTARWESIIFFFQCFWKETVTYQATFCVAHMECQGRRGHVCSSVRISREGIMNQPNIRMERLRTMHCLRLSCNTWPPWETAEQEQVTSYVSSFEITQHRR